ncbi:MAG: AI-2E family transporter [Acidobacteriota bacterium]
MFFFVRAGRDRLNQILYYVPLDRAEQERIMDKFISVTKATLKGALIIGALQELLDRIGLAVAGIPGPTFWGTIMGALSIFPGIGISLVWGPACLYLLFEGQWVTAIVLGLYCGAFGGTIDNFLRPGSSERKRRCRIWSFSSGPSAG